MIKLVSTVGFIITNEEGKILLFRRVKSGEVEEVASEGLVMPQKDEVGAMENEWQVVFGAVEEEDNPREVIMREIKKSLNCEVQECSYFNLYFYNISDNFIKKAAYFYGTISGNIETEDPSAVAQWFSLEAEELNKLNLIPEQKEVLLEFANFFQDKFLEKVEQ